MVGVHEKESWLPEVAGVMVMNPPSSTNLSDPRSTSGVGYTVIFCSLKVLHPFKAVNVYRILCNPGRAMEGLNTPEGEIPAPLKMPVPSTPVISLAAVTGKEGISSHTPAIGSNCT